MLADPARVHASQAGAPVALSAQSFASLLHLLRNHARVVRGEDLTTQLAWRGRRRGLASAEFDAQL